MSQLLASRSWVVPAVQSVHIFAIGVLLASSAVLYLRLGGMLRSTGGSVDEAARFAPWIAGAFIGLALTGVLLVVVEPHRQLLNDYFQLKMWLVLAFVVLSALVIGRARGRSASGHSPARQGAVRLVGVVAVTLLVTIIWCGRWIAYTQ